MIEGLNETTLAKDEKYFPSQNRKKTILPFEDHPQLPILVDILGRKEKHHVILRANFSEKMMIAFLGALAQHLANENIPPTLRNAELIYLNTEQIEQAAQNKTNKRTLFAIKDFELLRNNDKHLRSLLANTQNRLLIFANSKDDNLLVTDFDLLQLNIPSESDLFALLKQYRTELENFHHVLIPEEILWDAYLLAERYLSTTQPFEKAAQLLDSSAARASAQEKNDTSQFKPLLTTTLLTSVLSSWTQIPTSHLKTHQFTLAEFTQNMQQRLFGQDAAIASIAQGLQQAKAQLQEKTGPFCSFLFAGPSHTGKKTAALLFAEQLFKQLNTLFYTELHSVNAFAEIKMQRFLDKRYLPLKEVIQQTPYAILVFDQIEQASPTTLNALEEIFTSGHLRDADNNDYDFRQAVIILNTTLGGKQIVEFAKSLPAEDEIHEPNLMQLVMNNPQQKNPSSHQHYSPREIVQEITPEIMMEVPPALRNHLQIVPFFPLDKSAIEKIIWVKLKVLGKQLDARYEIELSYAPEVIRYLAQEVLLRQDKDTHVIDIDNILKQQLYFCIERTLLKETTNKNRPNQLFLQLNETGQLLHCDWIMTTVRQHAT